MCYAGRLPTRGVLESWVGCSATGDPTDLRVGYAEEKQLGGAGALWDLAYFNMGISAQPPWAGWGWMPGLATAEAPGVLS